MHDDMDLEFGRIKVKAGGSAGGHNGIKSIDDGDAELTATFTEEDGDTQEVAYYSYDTNYYAAVVDNKVYLVNKMNVKELFTAFESVAGTEEDNSGETDSEEATTDDTKSDLTDTSSESIEE